MYTEFYQFLLEQNYAMAEMFEKTKVIFTTDETIFEAIIDYCSAYGILYKIEVVQDRETEYRIYNLKF